MFDLDDDSLTSVDFYEQVTKQVPYKSIVRSESDDCFIYRQPDIFSQSFRTMDEIRSNNLLCDVILKVDTKSIPAHRIVLASTMPYFKAMFSYNMVESKMKEIAIQEIDAGALEMLVNFSYTGRVTINTDNVQGLMHASSFLQLNKVKLACAEFLMKKFSPSNVLGIRSFAESLGCDSLVVKCDKYVQRYFHEVSLTDEFLNVSDSELLDVVKKDELYVISEEQVFEGVMRWVKKNEDQRKCYLPRLLSYVRLPLLSPYYIADRVAKDQLIKSSHECRDLVDEARDYHLMPERRSLLPAYKSEARYCDHMIGHIFAVGGLTKSGDSLSTVEVYDPHSNTWRMAEAMSMLRSRVGVTVMQGRLFAVGGYNGSERLSTAEVFDPMQRAWSKVAPMHINRSAVGAAALNGRLYVCGGYDGTASLNTVECYVPESDSWLLGNSMQKHRSAGGVIAFEGYVYALGGHDGLSIFDSVERYDPKTGCWSDVTPMLTKRCRLGVAVLDRKLYVCGGYDGSTFLQTVEVFDPALKKWQFVSPMKVMRSRVALVSNMGKLWAIGGYDGVTNLASVEVYDPQRDEWSFVAPMCAHEGGVGAGVIPFAHTASY